MQISSLIDIIGGKLLNSPSISFIYSFKTDPSKVKEGDLFIAKKIDDIEVAVKNGAFAIILQEIYPIIDNEIAWIKVDCIELCMIQLIRFKLANYNLNIYYCDEISYDLIKVFISSSSKNIKLLSDNLNDFIKICDDITNDDVLISKEKILLDKIYPTNKNFNTDVYEIKNLVEHSLFEVSFTYQGIYFSKLKIASLYIPQFIAVYNFLELEHDFSKLKNFYNFKPLFLDKSLKLIDFGKSDKFVITQNNEKLIENELNYLKIRYKYAKTIFITSRYNTKLDNNQIVINDINEIKIILKNNSFNAAYIVGYNHDDIYNSLERLEQELSLF